MTTYAPSVPSLEAAVAALERLVASSAVALRSPEYDPASRLPQVSDLRQTQLGRRALEALALAAGPRVTSDAPHMHYGPACWGRGTALRMSGPACVSVRFDCGRTGLVPLRSLVLVAPGAAWLTEAAS